MIHELFCVVRFKLLQNTLVEADGRNEKTDRNGRDRRGDLAHSSHLTDENPRPSGSSPCTRAAATRTGDPLTHLHSLPLLNYLKYAFLQSGGFCLAASLGQQVFLFPFGCI